MVLVAEAGSARLVDMLPLGEPSVSVKLAMLSVAVMPLASVVVSAVGADVLMLPKGATVSVSTRDKVEVCRVTSVEVPTWMVVALAVQALRTGTVTVMTTVAVGLQMPTAGAEADRASAALNAVDPFRPWAMAEGWRTVGGVGFGRPYGRVQGPAPSPVSPHCSREETVAMVTEDRVVVRKGVTTGADEISAMDMDWMAEVLKMTGKIEVEVALMPGKIPDSVALTMAEATALKRKGVDVSLEGKHDTFI